MTFVKLLKNTTHQVINRVKLPRNKGYCPICESSAIFIKHGKWLRDYYHCEKCHSIPRNRALINALNIFYPNWKQSSLHESSPGGVLSQYLSAKAGKYSSSHYFTDVERGGYKGGHRSEDLSSLTFENEEFDLFITSDVFEHIMEPAKAFAEIARVLKPGGAHVFTMPWYPSMQKSVQRAKLEGNSIVNLQTPVYHGNPIDESGSLVSFDWGRDFTSFIFETSNLFTTIYLEKNKNLGLEAEFLEVFISEKTPGIGRLH